MKTILWHKNYITIRKYLKLCQLLDGDWEKAQQFSGQVQMFFGQAMPALPPPGYVPASRFPFNLFLPPACL